jgi:hypothetical protein
MSSAKVLLEQSDKFLTLLTLLTLLFITISCFQESSNVSGLISGESQLSLDSLALTTLSPVNSGNQNAYTIAGTCTTHDEIVAIKINTNEIETSAVCTLNIFIKIIDMSSITDSTSVNVEVNEQHILPLKPL